MIEQADVDQRERLFDTLGDQLIGLTRLGNSGRMVVCDDHGGGVPLQSLLDHLARMHARPVDRAAEQLFEVDQTVTVVELW